MAPKETTFMLLGLMCNKTLQQISSLKRIATEHRHVHYSADTLPQ